MKRAVIGLDGFVDEVVHVVDKRTGRDAYTRIETIGEYADRLAQGAGLSTNVEVAVILKIAEVKMKKLCDGRKPNLLFHLS